MSLIEEIERDLKGEKPFAVVAAAELVGSPYWPRIKAALLAAQTNIGGLENREKITVKLDNVRSVGLNLDGSISIYTNEAGGLPRFISIEHALYRLIEKFIDNADAARAKEE